MSLPAPEDSQGVPAKVIDGAGFDDLVLGSDDSCQESQHRPFGATERRRIGVPLMQNLLELMQVNDDLCQYVAQKMRKAEASARLYAKDKYGTDEISQLPHGRLTKARIGKRPGDGKNKKAKRIKK